MSYDDFLDFLAENPKFLPTPGTDITTLTDEELHDIYNTYVSHFNAFQATVKHNKALKAAVAADQQASVAELILTEEALEGMFEGTRFGDLMRFSKQTGNDAYLGQAVSKRTGTATPDGSLAGKLASEAGWYITMPKR
jgi:hypothetical protein